MALLSCSRVALRPQITWPPRRHCSGVTSILRGAPLVEIGYPCTDEVVLSRSYIGYRGALALIERTYTTAVRANTMA